MTIQRRFKENRDFGEWIRKQSKIDSINHGLTVNDIDWCFHKYKNNVDLMGARVVKLIMCVETKTHGKFPNFYQQELLFFMHQLLQKRKQILGLNNIKYAVWHFGFYVLSMEGTSPDNGKLLWCRFENNGNLISQDISMEKLINILGFIDCPQTMQPLKLARHHKVNKIEQQITLPLGIEIKEIVKSRY